MIAHPVKRFWLVAKRALSNISRAIWTHTCLTNQPTHSGEDVEMGECVGRDEAEAPEEISSEIPVKNEFRKSLQKVFSDANCVNRIMNNVDRMEHNM